MTDDVGRTRHGIKSLHNFLCRERTTNGVVGDFENLLKPLIHMDKRLTLRCHLIKARTTWYDGVPSPMQAETYDLKETIDLMKWRRQIKILHLRQSHMVGFKRKKRECAGFCHNDLKYVEFHGCVCSINVIELANHILRNVNSLKKMTFSPRDKFYEGAGK
uniref:FBD domain-containing protein n=1 Tax=Medicago truncatula TaxID=3880 RepID=Q2HV01_MEDTR|nr:hypothetical protein MtrDRAFT_AC149038g11v2 [Medicago truncatula]